VLPRLALRAALAGALLALACSAARQKDPDAALAREEEAARVASGEGLFRAYCASCHGPAARGDGPVAGALRTPPADLTRIAQRRGGRFEAAEIAGYIDGRSRVPAHGEVDMPVWGRRYDDRNQGMLQDETLLSPGMIFNVVEYLRSIQASPTPVQR
jgi:mono/diheme cytochrome c family protein